MQVIEVQFPAKRYHANPWDAHVNEGRVEWPPSPWRIVRALLAVGYNKLGWKNEPTATAVSLIEKLASDAPQYVLPKSTQAHTRHYMPYTEGRNEKKTKVFDTFVKLASDDATMLIRYDVKLEPEEESLLEEMVEGLAYLGRAESWVDARLLQENELVASTDENWIAVADSDSTNRTRLLAPMTAESFSNWREEEVESASTLAESQAEQVASAKEKDLTAARRKKAREKAAEPYPASFIAVLQQANPTWQKAGWPRPPGSRWVDYNLPEDLFDRQPLTPTPVNRPFAKPTAILLAIDGEGKRGTLRPPMRRALPLMELLHSEAVRYATRVLDLGHLPELMGKDADGNAFQGNHSHAHWLPLSLFGKGKIDHVLISATDGFSRKSVQAISSIRWAYAKGIRTLSVNMVGQGTIAGISKQLHFSSNVNQDSLGVLGTSTVWESTTPLVLRKYLHKRGKKTVEGQIVEELRERGYPEPIRIEVWSQQEVAKRKLKGFLMRRKPGKQQPPFEQSWGATLHFSEPIKTGPISLGYASHFGLGLFQAGQSRDIKAP